MLQNGFGSTIKTASNTTIIPSLNQPKTANLNSLWAYIPEGLLLAGYLRLRFEGLSLGGGGYCCKGLLLVTH